jgi:hypothetical protein
MIYETLEDVKKAGLRKWARLCIDCGEGAPIELFARIQRNGVKLWNLRCFFCKRTLGGAIAHQNIPFHFRKTTPESIDCDPSRPCTRCGKWENGVELHHWAPQEFFVDSERWPLSYLCRGCHGEWHRIMKAQKSIWRAADGPKEEGQGYPAHD